MRLFLVRHGQTDWSLSGQHTGTTDIALNAAGEAGARALEPLLRVIVFSHVLTSPRQRARRTCELTGLGAEARVEPDLAEWDYGDYEGQRTIDIRKTRPGWSLFRDGCPGGESPEQISARADRLVAKLRALEGTIALFSHGHFGRVLAMRWIGLAVIQAAHFMLDVASLSEFGFDPADATAPVLTLWNGGPARALFQTSAATRDPANEPRRVPRR